MGPHRLAAGKGPSAHDRLTDPVLPVRLEASDHSRSYTMISSSAIRRFRALTNARAFPR